MRFNEAKKKETKEIRYCEKCGKQLPEDYEEKICEHCRSTKIQKAKKVMGTVVTTGLVIVATGVRVATKGKINLRK